MKETCKPREKNKELEEKIKLFDDAKKKNKVLEESVRKHWSVCRVHWDITVVFIEEC